MKLPWCLSVCFLQITFEPIDRLSWNSTGKSCHWRWPRRHNSYFRSFNHSKIADVQTDEMDAKLVTFNVGLWTSKDEKHLIRYFAKNKKYHHGIRLKVKIDRLFCFLITTREPLNIDIRSLVQQKIMDISTSFIWVVGLFHKVSKYGDGGTCWGFDGTNAEPLCAEFCNFV
jgi:hypothetical protein